MCFIAHLSQRLIWWAYMIGPSSSSVVVIHTLQTSSPQKPMGQSKSDFIWSFCGMGEQKFAQMVLVTWSRWPPYPYMVKTLKKNLLFWNQKADDLETWYASLGAQVLPSLLKWWPYVDLYLFWQGQIWSLMLLYGKKVKQWIFQKLLYSMKPKLVDAVN